ncbi:MAG: FAD-binding oxidoreductase [Azospirillaceae bacterium]
MVGSAAQRSALDGIRAVLGPSGVVEEARAMAKYVHSWRDDYGVSVPLVARPSTTEEVAEVVRRCAAADIAIVPQGGNTGLTGAAQAMGGRAEIILSLERMTRIRDVDPVNDTMTVEAGVVLQTVQDRAREAGRLFPLSLAAEGSCTIGGNLATNAGGVQVLRYGNARQLVLGLEAVLADGRVWSGLTALRKDNAGYDLKQLFLGTEGTLGIITAAVLKLFPLPRDSATAFLALENPAAALDLLVAARERFAEAVSSFELIQRRGVELVARHIDAGVDPLATAYPWYVLVELTGQEAPGTLRQAIEEWLAGRFEAGQVADGAIAASEAQAATFWRLRESLADALLKDGVSVNHDVSVPVASVPDFIAAAEAAIGEACPGIRPLSFGHLGDGNIHFNPSQPEGSDAGAFRAEKGRLNRIVHDTVARFSGSISAEHGIGQLRREELVHYKPAVDLEMMRTLKRAFDPQGILNPGKVLRADGPA